MSLVRRNFAKQKNLNNAYKIIDKELESVTGGLDFSNSRVKITTILLGSILLVGKTSQSLAYGIGEKEISQNIVSVGQKV